MANNNYNNRKNKNSRPVEYASSPYNFIPFSDRVLYRYNGPDELPKHNDFISYKIKDTNKDINKKDNVEELYSGIINYTITCHTPLFISDGKENFFKINNEYTIPGSTIRGKVRTNTEILSLSYPHFIEDQTVWFRGLADKSRKVRDDYEANLKESLRYQKDTNITDYVKAGYLTKDKKGKYRIIPALEDKTKHTFKSINEKYFETGLNIKSKQKQKLMKLFNGNEWSQFIRKIKNNPSLSLRDKQRQIGMTLRKYKNNNYNPYFLDVKHNYNVNIDDNSKINIYDINHNDTLFKGTLMNSSAMGSKQNHYLIFDKDFKTSELEVPEKVINNFMINVLHQQKNKDKYMMLNLNEFKDNMKNIENLRTDLENLEPNKFVPVFYKLKTSINSYKEVFALGSTPYMKLPFNNKVTDGIKVVNKDKFKIDYAEAIYGFTDKEVEPQNTNDKDNKKDKTMSYAGRVSFENAKLLSSNVSESKNSRILSNPKITSFQLYLNQYSDNLNKLKTYNDNDFELRGYKFYWLKDSICKNESEYNPNDKIKTTISALEGSDNKNLQFEGKIHFKNLTNDELGLLLYSIKPFKDGRENIGQGKPYGFGQVEFDITNVQIENHLSNFMSFESNYITLDNFDIDDFKNDFITKFNSSNNYVSSNKNLTTYKFGSERHVILRDFYNSKTIIVNPKKSEFNYMELKDFKNRSRLLSLEDIKKKYFNNNLTLSIKASHDNSKYINLNNDKEKTANVFKSLKNSLDYKKDDLKSAKNDIDIILNTSILTEYELNQKIDEIRNRFIATLLASDYPDNNILFKESLEKFITKKKLNI